MGQYYYIVNVTKQEFISPCTFDDGLQLCSLSTDGGSMTALAMLLANGNGKGTGDFTLPYDAKLDSNPHDTGTPEYKAFKYRNRTPSPLFDIVGSWAGDQIVIAGDYGEDGRWLTPQQHRTGKERVYGNRCSIADRDGTRKPDKKNITCNLHTYAEWYFTDVGPAVLAVINACGMGRNGTDDTRWEEMIENYGKRYLWKAWLQDRLMFVGRGKKRTSKYDLRWLPYEAVDSLMLSFETQEETVACRKWLMRQELSPLVREILPTYNLRKTPEGLIRDRGNHEPILIKYNVARDKLGRVEHQPLLPSKKLLDAAMDVAIIEKFQALDQPAPPATADPGSVELIAKRAQVPYRTRVIDVDSER